MRLWNEIKSMFTEEVSLSEMMNPSQTRARIKQGLLLGRELWRSVRRDDAFNMAASLAFKTLIALVPVLAVSLAIVAMLEPEEAQKAAGQISYTEQFVSSIRDKVPDFPGIDSLILSIRDFASNAAAIAGIGFLVLFWSAFSLLNSIEYSFNKIWQVTVSRPLLSKLSAFVATLIIVPILMVLSVLIMAYIQSTAESVLQTNGDTVAVVEGDVGTTVSEEAESSAPVMAVVPDAPAAAVSQIEDVAPEIAATETVAPLTWKDILLQIVLVGASVLITCIAMTAMFYLMPFTVVRLKAALVGGFAAGLFFEGAKLIFRYYALHLVHNYTRVYGPLLAVPLFLLWVWLVWIIILLGVEIAFTAQNFRNLAMKAELERRGIASRIYLAVRIVLRACRYFRVGETPSEFVDKSAEELQVAPYMVREIIAVLLKNNVLRRVVPDEDNYVPAKDITALTVSEVVQAIQSDGLDVPTAPDDAMRRYLNDVFGRVERDSQAVLAALSFADLVKEEERWCAEENDVEAIVCEEE